MTSDTAQPIALVTGATRGIGREIALDLARTHRVVAGGRDRRAVEAVIAELDAVTPSAQPHLGLVADLADGAQLAEALSGLASELDLEAGLDVLVHSAGVIGTHAPIAELERDDFRSVFELNVVAVADLTRRLLPGLRARRGLVIAINSGAGFTSGPSSSAYCASKFTLRALTDALREEERANGVRVTSIHPGRVDTDMQHELRAAEGGTYEPHRYLEARAVAEAVRLAVDSPRSGSIESLSIRPTG